MSLPPRVIQLHSTRTIQLTRSGDLIECQYLGRVFQMTLVVQSFSFVKNIKSKMFSLFDNVIYTRCSPFIYVMRNIATGVIVVQDSEQSGKI